MNHVYISLSRPRRNTCYDLRFRHHYRLLTHKPNSIVDSDFIIRMLFKDSYWHLFSFYCFNCLLAYCQVLIHEYVMLCYVRCIILLHIKFSIHRDLLGYSLWRAVRLLLGFWSSVSLAEGLHQSGFAPDFCFLGFVHVLLRVWMNVYSGEDGDDSSVIKVGRKITKTRMILTTSAKVLFMLWNYVESREWILI